MINFKANERKKLKFDISVAGVQVNDLTGSFRFVTENIEYGFPIKIEEGKIIVDIPPLKDVIKNIKESKYIAKLEILANDSLLTPWSDSISIEVPVVVEAKVQEIEDDKKEKVKVKVNTIDEEAIKEVLSDFMVEKKESIKESRLVIDITTDDEMKKAKELGKKYNKDLIGYSPMDDEVIFDGDKKILDKIKREFETSVKKKKSKFAKKMEN